MKNNKTIFILAPMDEVTDTVFRQIVASTAKPDMFFTEFVNVDGLNSPGREKLLPKLRFTSSEQPLIAQIWGKNPDNFYLFCKQVADGSLAKELGLPAGVNFAGVDLNMGCPAKSEVQNGTCSALIKPENRELALQLIRASREGLNDGHKEPRTLHHTTRVGDFVSKQGSVVQSSGTPLPLSVKTRLGFNEVDMSWFETLLNEKLNMLTIHGRTRKQMSKFPADWDKIGEVARMRDQLSPTTLIVGNGDVESRKHGEELAKQHQLDGIMIGRGVFHDPFVFADNSPWPEMSKQQKIDLYKKHVELFAKSWPEGHRPVRILNKFCKIYISGWDGAKEFREHLMKAESTTELLEELTKVWV